MFEKPVLNRIVFGVKDICTASNPGEEPSSSSFDCGTDTGVLI